MARAPIILSPRKKPIQGRSIYTVKAIFEGCIQVLLATGLERLTTTKVAERAGVSVGTLYQYFPNKESLLAAVLEDHLSKVVADVEAACLAAKGQTLEVMVDSVVTAFVRAKTEDAPASKALYAVASDIGGTVIVARLTQRAQLALCSMLATAPNAHFEDLSMVSYVLTTSLVGPVQGLLSADAPPAMVLAVKTHLVQLIQAYLQRLQMDTKVTDLTSRK